MNYVKSMASNKVIAAMRRQLAHLLAQITDGSAKAIVRCEDIENGLEI